MRIELDVRGIDAFVQDLDGAGDRIRAISMSSAERVGAILESALKDKAPSATGVLVNSIVHDAKVTGSGVEAEAFSHMAYAKIVDTGRGPGAWPPFDAIHRWVQLKVRRGEFSATEADIPRITYLVRRAIAARGTKATRYIERGVASAMPLINRELADLETRIANILE
jgi:hypothetical protein